MKQFSWILLCAVLLVSSCKDEDPVEAYVPFASQIVGTWIVTASIQNNNENIEDYPESIEESSFTFSSKSAMTFMLICNAGKADRYLVSENGGIIIQGLQSTNLVCNPAALSSEWAARIANALSNATHVKISNDKMVFTASDDYSLKLKKK